MSACRQTAKNWFVVSAIVTSWLLTGCGATQPVRVLPAQSTAVTASLGGPVVPGKSPTVVLPYLTAGAMHGVSEGFTIHGNVHLLMAAFAVAGVDVGASGRLLRGDGLTPEITGSARVFGFMKLADEPKPRLYPTFSANASWSVRTNDLIYAGTHVTMQWTPNDTYVSPFVGYSYSATENLSVQLEFIWQAADHNTSAGVLEGISSINGFGSFGIFLAGALRI